MSKNRRGREEEVMEGNKERDGEEGPKRWQWRSKMKLRCKNKWLCPNHSEMTFFNNTCVWVKVPWYVFLLHESVTIFKISVSLILLDGAGKYPVKTETLIDLPHQLQKPSKNVAVFFSFLLPPSLSLLSLSLFLCKAVGLACRVKKISKQILFF